MFPRLLACIARVWRMPSSKPKLAAVPPARDIDAVTDALCQLQVFGAGLSDLHQVTRLARRYSFFARNMNRRAPDLFNELVAELNRFRMPPGMVASEPAFAVAKAVTDVRRRWLESLAPGSSVVCKRLSSEAGEVLAVEGKRVWASFPQLVKELGDGSKATGGVVEFIWGKGAENRALEIEPEGEVW